MKNENFGSFEIKSGKVNITDPCYKADGSCNLIDLKAKKGTWSAEGKISDGRVSKLRAWAEGYKETEVTEEFPAPIGVDSGQVGIFDSANYPKEETGEYKDKESFYGKVCELTATASGDITETGVVSRSGYGDGSYMVSAAYDDDKLVVIEIDFMPEEEQTYCQHCGEPCDVGEDYCDSCRDNYIERDEDDEDR